MADDKKPKYPYRSTYKGIVFAEGYNEKFAVFKEQFENLEVFKRIPHLERTDELKRVHRRVLAETKRFAEQKAKDEAKKAKDLEVVSADEVQPENVDDGNSSDSKGTSPGDQ